MFVKILILINEVFGIGLGLFSDIYLIEDLRRELCVAIRKLQESGLLLKTDYGDIERCVRMHDVVRDFAHWITLRENNIFMVKEGFEEWPISELLECCTAISLWDNNIDNFPRRLKFPKLKVLFFTGKNQVKVPKAFVKGMKALRVSHFKNVAFSLEAVKYATNLRTLYVINCKLKNISSLGNMKNLEIIALKNTNICELPKELVALPRLKSLHFSCYGEQEVNFPPNLLSRLTSSLQELHVTSKNNINLWELNSLSRLTALSLRVSTAQCLQYDFVFPKLVRFSIAVNENLRLLEELTFRTLIINEKFSSSLNAFKELFCSVKSLTLRDVKEHKNIIPSVDEKGLNELTYIELRYCNDMECLIDTAGEKGPTTALSNLVELKMQGMRCLKELCHGPHPMRFLQKLKDVTVKDCDQLKAVFEMDGILEKEETSQQLLPNLRSLDLFSLPELECIWRLQPTHQYHHANLQRLIIKKCYRLEQVFDFSQEMAELEENRIPPLSNLKWLELLELPKLRCIWKGPTHLFKVHNLMTMQIDWCLKLEYLFTTRIAQSLVHLKALVISSCDSLEHVIIEEQENEDEIISNTNGDPICWPELITLKIIGCRNLKYVFPITLAQGLPKLKSIEIIASAQLKQVFNITNKMDGHQQQEIVLPKLKNLYLENVQNLSRFCPENFVMPVSLKEFKVRNCPQLTHFGNLQGVALQAEFEGVSLYGSKELLCSAKNLTMDRVLYHKNLSPNLDPKRLNELTSLKLKDGSELECLIDTTDECHVSTGAFLNLVELVIENMTGFIMLCNGPFPKGFLQNLKTMRVMNCGQLQEVFPTEELFHDMEENKAPLLSNLTSLKLMSLQELKCIWKGPSYFVSLQSLTVAEISCCDRLKYLFSPSLAQSLVLLEQLKIEYCHDLEHITTELEIDDMEIDHEIEPNGGKQHPPLLPKLTSLEIRGCPTLKYVSKIPLAQGLPQLKSVSILDSPQLRQVFNVAKEKNGVEHAFALPSLQHLRLENLINLSCFSTENHPIVLPSFEKLVVVSCPRLENFTIQPEVNEHVQLKVLCLSNAGFVELLHIHQLQGPIQVASLKYLRALNVSNCNRLKHLFSSMLARNLLLLHNLEIECCEELEEIIEMEDEASIAASSQGHLQPIFFPSLHLIDIFQCSNLKSLFPISVTHSLLELKSVNIVGASKLKQVFRHQGELNAEDDQNEIVLPKLSELYLSELPRLKSFAPKGYYFQLPSLKYFQVRQCPRLTTSLSMDSKHHEHAITEAPQQVQSDTTECFTTIQEIVDDQSISNDIFWLRKRVEDQAHQYMKVGETTIILPNEEK